MAPSVERMFDHTIRVWGARTSRDDLGAEQREYRVLGVYGAKVNRSTAPVADVGAGLAPTGRLRLYTLIDVDILPRDVIELVSGPDAPGNWEVDQPVTRPRAHHAQVDCIAWHGVLPETDVEAS